MPLARGRSVRFGGLLHRDSIEAAPSGAASAFVRTDRVRRGGPRSSAATRPRRRRGDAISALSAQEPRALNARTARPSGRNSSEPSEQRNRPAHLSRTMHAEASPMIEGPAAADRADRADRSDRVDVDAGTDELLRRTAEMAIAYRRSLPERRVGPQPGVTVESLRAALGGPLPKAGTDPDSVIERLAADVEPGLTAMSSPRFFGFVIGGSVPAALAADWLTSTWDQNVALYLATPSAAVVEEVAARWLVELLGLPVESSVGFTSGATMANFTSIAAARHAVLRRLDWDVEDQGLVGAPPIRVVIGADAHVSLKLALRLAGLGLG